MKPNIGSELLGTASVPNAHVAQLPGTGEKEQTKSCFKGLKSPSIMLQFILAVGGKREGCPRSDQARSLSFGDI